MAATTKPSSRSRDRDSYMDLIHRFPLKPIKNDRERMSQAQMGKVIGSESAVSMFLKGERALSKAQIKALVERFRLDASLFL